MTDTRLRRHALGFLEVADRPTPAELADYYERQYYQTERGSYRKAYAPEELTCINLRIEQRAAQALALWRGDGSGRLLDVGCGEGFVLSRFSKEGWQVEGIDFSVAGVEAMNPDMASFVEQGDIFRLLEARIKRNAGYDLVWLGNVLEHVLDPVGLMNSLRRLVQSDGVLVVTVPNDGTTYHEGLYSDGLIDRRFWVAIPDHMSYFCADSLRNISESTGWSVGGLLGDFPIDLFLANPCSNYVNDSSKGPHAHAARLRLEAIIGAKGPEAANRFYASLADVGLGRNLTAFLRPKPEGNPT